MVTKGATTTVLARPLLLCVLAEAGPAAFGADILPLPVLALLVDVLLHRSPRCVRRWRRLDLHGDGSHGEISNCRLRSLDVPLSLTIRQCSCARGFFVAPLAERTPPHPPPTRRGPAIILFSEFDPLSFQGTPPSSWPGLSVSFRAFAVIVTSRAYCTYTIHGTSGRRSSRADGDHARRGGCSFP